MRNLATLAAARPSTALTRFITVNADWAWNASHTGGGANTRLGLQWSQANDGSDAARQASALDLLNAAIPYDAPQTNLALGKAASSSANCSGGETATQAVDGKVSSKWCAPGESGASWLEIDLGAATAVGRIIVRHAGAGGEPSGYNTQDFTVRTSVDDATWADAAAITGNARAVTIHRVYPAKAARYVRIDVTKPQSATDAVATRIDEVEVFAR
jgi:hypothetical protein